MEYFKKYQDAIWGGGIAVALGFLSGYAMKSQVIPAKNFKEAVLSFATVTIAGIAANEIKEKYPQ